MSVYKIGAGSRMEAGKQSAFGTAVSTTNLINFTSESITVSATKSSEGNLIASKTANQKDLTQVAVDGSISTVLRPEFADFLFEWAMGIKTGTAYTLAVPNDDLPVATFRVNRGGIGKSYKDITCKTLTITASAQDYVKADFDIQGVDELPIQSWADQASEYTKPSYRCTHARLLFANAGTAITPTSSDWASCGVNAYDVESVKITIDNGIEDGPATYCGGVYKNRPVKGQRTISVEFNIPYSTAVDTLRNSYFLADPAPNIALLLGFTTSNTGENITIYMPHVSITEGGANVGGTGIIDSTFKGEALSVGATEPITVTVTHASANNANSEDDD